MTSSISPFWKTFSLIFKCAGFHIRFPFALTVISLRKEDYNNNRNAPRWLQSDIKKRKSLMSSHLNSGQKNPAPCSDSRTSQDDHHSQDVVSNTSQRDSMEQVDETTTSKGAISPSETEVTRSPAPITDPTQAAVQDEEGNAGMSRPIQTSEGCSMDDVTIPKENIPPDITRSPIPITDPSEVAVLGELGSADLTSPTQMVQRGIRESHTVQQFNVAQSNQITPNVKMCGNMNIGKQHYHGRVDNRQTFKYNIAIHVGQDKTSRRQHSQGHTQSLPQAAAPETVDVTHLKELREVMETLTPGDHDMLCSVPGDTREPLPSALHGQQVLSAIMFNVSDNHTQPAPVAARADDVDNSSNSHPKELKEVMKTLGRDGHVMLQAIPGDTLDSLLSALCQQHSEQGYNVFPLIGLSQCLEERLPDNKCLLLIHCALGNAKLDPMQYKTFFEINLCSISSPVHHHIVFLVYPHVLLEFQYLNNAARPCIQNSIRLIEFKQDYFISDYFNLFKGMLEDTTHSQMLGALLALTMQGHNCLEQGKEETEAQLDILGFQWFSPTQLQNYSQWLVGSLLAENRSEFVTRDVYSAAGLAVARAFSDRITLKTCDVRFLVQHVHTKHNRAADHAEERTMTDTVLVLTGPSSVLLLTERMLEAMVTGQLSEICQHPCLHSSEFLQEFEEFCREKNKLHDVINAVDPQYGLPLLYWSVWSLSCEFSVWCLRLVMSQHKGDTASEVLLSTALLAALVTNTTEVDMSQFVKKVCENLSPLKEVTSMKEIVLPFPSKQKRYTEKLHQICSRLKKSSLCYLGTVPLHTLQQLLTMKLTDTLVNVIVCDIIRNTATIRLQ